MASSWTDTKTCVVLPSSIAVTENGWTDASMAVWWLKNFDEQTREKAAGRPRLLLVDGHNSHYTVEFIRYARDANIVTLCYPSHTTHVLQGLDVVAFAILKRRWHAARDRWESEHWPQKLSKAAFIEVFGTVFLETMTPELTKECFRKTGIVPLDAEVVTAQQMAPSRQHSTKIDVSHLSSPVKRIVSFQRHLIASTQTHGDDSDVETTDLHPSQDPRAISASTTHLSEDASDIPPPLRSGGCLRMPAASEMDADEVDINDGANGGGGSEPQASVHARGADINNGDGSGDDDDNDDNEPRVPSSTQLISQPSTHRTPPQLLRGMFSGSSAEFLVNSMPIQSSFKVPDPVYGAVPIMPALTREPLLSKSTPRTKADLLTENKLHRQELEACRRELEVHRNALRESSNTVDVLNAQLALSNMTYAKARQQLASQENKHAAPKRKEISTALGRVLTHDSFLDAQLEIDRRQDDAEEAKKMKEQLEKDWKKYEEEYNEGVRIWKAEVERRKAAKEKGRLLKPKKMTKKVWLAAHVGTVGEDIATDALGDVGSDMDDEDGDN